MKVVMGLNNSLHNVPVRIEPGQSSLAPPPFNSNINNKIFKPASRRAGKIHAQFFYSLNVVHAQNQIKSSLQHIRIITLKRVTSGVAHLRHLASKFLQNLKKFSRESR